MLDKVKSTILERKPPSFNLYIFLNMDMGNQTPIFNSKLFAQSNFLIS